jgi:hypothetical protein
MFGCIRRLGCLVLLALIAGVWYWYAHVEPSRSPKTASSSSVAGAWESLSQPNAVRGKRAVTSLGQRSGPVFANLTASEAASYIFLAASKGQLPPSAQSISSSIIGDRLYVRATIALNELGAKKVLGPLAGMLSERDTVQLGGTMKVIRPGLGQFLVEDVKLAALKVPSPLVPALVAEMRRGVVPQGVAKNGFPMPLPDYISDIRIASGRIIVYKNTQ